MAKISQVIFRERLSSRKGLVLFSPQQRLIVASILLVSSLLAAGSALGQNSTLLVGQPDTEVYGNRVGGIEVQDSVEFDFIGQSEDLELTLSGHDIDVSDEVGVFLNNAFLGDLSITPNNGQGPSSFMLDASQQINNAVNTLRFQQLRNPNLKWGVSELLLSTDESPIQNAPPISNDDDFSMGQGQILVIASPGVLSNDTDDSEDTLSAVEFTTTNHGFFNAPGRRWVYLPARS